MTKKIVWRGNVPVRFLESLKKHLIDRFTDKGWVLTLGEETLHPRIPTVYCTLKAGKKARHGRITKFMQGFALACQCAEQMVGPNYQVNSETEPGKVQLDHPKRLTLETTWACPKCQTIDHLFISPCDNGVRVGCDLCDFAGPAESSNTLALAAWHKECEKKGSTPGGVPHEGKGPAMVPVNVKELEESLAKTFEEKTQKVEQYQQDVQAERRPQPVDTTKLGGPHKPDCTCSRCILAIDDAMLAASAITKKADQLRRSPGIYCPTCKCVGMHHANCPDKPKELILPTCPNCGWDLDPNGECTNPERALMQDDTRACSRAKTIDN